jgi:hypothetical protein
MIDDRNLADTNKMNPYNMLLSPVLQAVRAAYTCKMTYD